MDKEARHDSNNKIDSNWKAFSFLHSLFSVVFIFYSSYDKISIALTVEYWSDMKSKENLNIES